jgi:hypothetical protein
VDRVVEFLANTGPVVVGALVGALGGYVVARMSRDEARAARFADRVRELGAIVSDSTERIWDALNTGARDVNVGADLPRQMRELRLVARQPETINAVDSLKVNLDSAVDHRAGGPLDPARASTEEKVLDAIEGGQGSLERLRKSRRRFDNAIRAELGLDPLPAIEASSEDRQVV